MNNKIKLAVAGAVLAASSAQAGIVIPAGDWTLDINGNVNAFANFQDIDKNETIVGTATVVGEDGNGEDSNQGIGTGLLPSWIGFTGTTRQNDVDVSFTISFQPGVSENSWHGDGTNGSANGVHTTFANRQTFITFGDKSWGSVKLGKDLGIYAGNAILSDMTLLGVGAGGATSGPQGNTTLGGIGTGYQYAAWKGQITYTTPNMNGFEAKIGIFNPNAFDADSIPNTYQDRFGMEGQLQYSWTGDVAGKVWASGASYDVTTGNGASAPDDSTTISAWDIGANVSFGNATVTGYYYDGNGNGITAYVQATYVIPTGTKLGASYGISTLDEASGETATTLIEDQERWTIGAYHPLTKHLNLVAEYSDVKNEAHNGNKNEYDTFSVGAILFF
jgi:predicted porin